MRFPSLRYPALLIMLAAISQACAAEAVSQKNLWDVLEGMRAVSAEEAAMEEFFGAKIDSRSGNGYWQYHTGPGPRLVDGVEISKFGFSTKNDNSAAPLTYLDIAGDCVSVADVKKAYPDLLLKYGYSNPHSKNEPYLVHEYWSTNEYGKTIFFFKRYRQPSPECLSNVKFSLNNWPGKTTPRE